jgi:hypothetical protein
MAPESSEETAFPDGPEANNPVKPGGSQEVPIRGKCQAVDAFFVPDKLTDPLAGR